ncbi:putative glutamate carboxypeptidase 2 [Dorcoceras hygrometricum]|uniref:Putative glutamate carboxypeptidase 2 n=1 Tax=Dorcoceras hygrometricum TaxID=472368 RepID=A0A2Z7BG46_9LAMI|nr:putative glutamate carboxypeptidase 2 [Dorcoceras hygrometricum]
MRAATLLHACSPLCAMCAHGGGHLRDQFAQLSLAEVVAHLKRAGDVKKGKVVTAAEKGRVAVVTETEGAVGSADGFEMDCFQF